MVAALLGLLVVTVGFVVGVWAVFALLFASFEVDAPGIVALVPAVVTLIAIAGLEYVQRGTVERLADAHPVDHEAAPELYETTTRIAAQLDVPVPTIAVSDRDAPEALVVGYRPSDVHLVLSLGTIEALEPAELEAVIAHELAHVRNRDAMVMTAVSVPVVLADGLRSRLTAIENPGWGVIVVVPLGLVSSVVWVLGRTITARLARVRERAADRTAAEVTGSPAALAGALERLDREIAETPERDLREVSGVSSLSILPLTPDEPEKVMLGPEGDVEPAYWRARTLLHRLERWLFESHPPTEQRLEALAAMQRER
ncbi:peptidase M48 [Natrarchaeobaculum aegyptiacum]|uniref:Peptidase M48 n=2 Tax=Natrarchaeobaculum aegyptiacum TaxID=745377 RepID=A0A2Z2HWZ7_9EURY|nr:peptidase M48 [Natrarchaeobaculum aegyptiacum]